jgi:hypothetical protein
MPPGPTWRSAAHPDMMAHGLAREAGVSTETVYFEHGRAATVSQDHRQAGAGVRRRVEGPLRRLVLQIQDILDNRPNLFSPSWVAVDHLSYGRTHRTHVSAWVFPTQRYLVAHPSRRALKEGDHLFRMRPFGASVTVTVTPIYISDGDDAHFVGTALHAAGVFVERRVLASQLGQHVAHGRARGRARRGRCIR